MKKIIALLIAMMLVLSMTSALAAKITINSTADPDEVSTDTTVYTYYKILDASIEDATKITVDTDSGASTAGTGEDAPKVSYYVTTQEKATALEGTGLFTVTKDITQDKWYVELKDKNTSADDIATALDGIKDAFSDASGTFAQTTPGGSATKDGLDPGYYLITSTLGDKLAVQTLADITINTKNTYPGDDKTVATTDLSAEIGSTVTYTLTVDVPASANDVIELTDTMTEGLTFKEMTSVQADGADVAYTSVPAELNGTNVTANGNKFSMTFAADTVKANQGKTITIIYKAIVNEKAVVGKGSDDADGNDNTLELKYGQNFVAVPKKVEVDTQSFTFDKVDGSDENTKLPGAIFELQKDGTALNLIEVTAGEEYRIATAEEIADSSVTKVTQMTTAGKVITVKGVDGDLTYTLVEIQAPTGYNLPDNPETEVTAGTDNELEITIKNNKGATLPSTGGIGTTIFYIAGSILVLAAAVLLITKRRMGHND